MLAAAVPPKKPQIISWAGPKSSQKQDQQDCCFPYSSLLAFTAKENIQVSEASETIILGGCKFRDPECGLSLQARSQRWLPQTPNWGTSQSCKDFFLGTKKEWGSWQMVSTQVICCAGHESLAWKFLAFFLYPLCSSFADTLLQLHLAL